MAAKLKALRDSHGRTIGYEFVPSMKMLRVAIEFNKAENADVPTDDILKKCGVSNAEWNRWRNEYVLIEYDENKEPKGSKNFFEEWLEDVLEIKEKEERELLRLIGMQKAVEGNYNFWKDLSRTYGAISAEQVEHKHTILQVKIKADATPAELNELRQKLLASNRGAVGNAKGAGMARLTSKKSGS